MIEVKGFKHIVSKMIQRKWGCELRFTVVRDSDGKEFNEVILIDNEKLSDEELSLLVENHLSKLTTIISSESIEEMIEEAGRG
jgi:hypothetical protein